MAIFVFPLKSINGSNSYSNDDFRQYFANFIRTGIIPNIPLPGATGFQVLQTETPSMNVIVGGGVAWIAGGQIMNTSPKTFQIPAPLTNQSRKDSIVIQWNNSANDGKILYKENSTQVIQTNDVYELQICTILIPANAASISQAQITDTRADPTVCGYATLFEQVKTGDLLAQFKSELESNKQTFDQWFDHVKGQLSTDVAGKLQVEINELEAEAVHKTGDETIAGKKTFENIEVTETFTQPYISTSFEIGYGLSVTAKRIGHLVTITFKGKNTTTLGSGAHPIERIPLGYRPIEAESIDPLVQGRHLDTYYYFNPDSTIVYMGEDVPVNSYFRGTRSYFTNDPWPITEK